MKLDGRMIIWPVNIDRKLTCSQGRIAPRSATVESPEIDEMQLAAERAGIKPELVDGKAYPSRWWEPSGYLVVEKKYSKSETLKQLVKQIDQQRSEAPPKPTTSPKGKKRKQSKVTNTQSRAKPGKPVNKKDAIKGRKKGKNKSKQKR